jgi:hypothetical protein
LRESTTGSRTEDFDDHQTGSRARSGGRQKRRQQANRVPNLRNPENGVGGNGLQFGVGVGADFAVELDLFVIRSYPFHQRLLQILGM